MNFGSYVSSFEEAVNRGTFLMCKYCGEQSIALGNVGVCSNCEMPINTDAKSLSSKNPQLFTDLKELADKVVQGNYQDAAKIYDSLYNSSKDPGYLYGKALLLIKQSNRQIEKITYDKKGFMEENASLRDDAAKLTSGAKALLQSAINECEHSTKEERPPLGAVYLLFLCHMKLSNLKEADILAGTIAKIDSYLGTYAKMMLDINLGKQDTVIDDAERLLKPESFSANALFYIALALFDKGKYRESKTLVELLKKHTESSSINSLAFDIENATHV